VPPASGVRAGFGVSLALKQVFGVVGASGSERARPKGPLLVNAAAADAAMSLLGGDYSCSSEDATPAGEGAQAGESPAAAAGGLVGSHSPPPSENGR
jgi:hypothetical protein